MKKLILLLIVSTTLFVHKVSAAKFTWTGTTSTNWSINTNWSPNGVPSTTDTVKIVSTTNGPRLQANTTVKELEITSGSLNLNTYSLTVSNNSYFYAGTISNGNLIIRGTYSLYNGTTFSCTIDAIVGRTVFSGGTFNSAASFEQTSTSNSNGAGGCVFNAKTTIKKTGASYLYLGLTSADTFNGPVKFVNTATYAIQVGQGTVANFNDSIILESSGGGVNFGNSTTGGATLASGKKIVIGSGGFTLGVLLLKNFTQQGSTSQNLQLTNNAIVSIISSTFNGAFTIVAPTLVLSTSTFNGVSDFTKSSTSTSQSNGGNTFNAAATFRNTSSNTGAFRLATNERDIFNSDVTFITTNGYINPAFSGVSEFKGNISINSSLVVFNAGTGTLSCTGSNNQAFSGTANYAIGKLLINKPSGSVTLSKPTTLDSSLTLTSGKIISSATNLLSLKASCVLNGGNVNSFIEGPIKKTGNTAFKFAVGKGNDYRPVSISNPPTVTDAYTAEYFNVGQSNGNTLDTTLMLLNTCDYWNLTRNAGSSQVQVTLSYKNSVCDLGEKSQLRITNWNGSSWANLGNNGSTDSTVLSQTASSGNSNYSIAQNRKGNSSSNNIRLSSQVAINDSLVTLTDSSMWFSFIADSTNTRLKISNYSLGQNAANISKVFIYSGSINALSFVDSSFQFQIGDSIAKIAFASQIGTQYFINLTGKLNCTTCSQLSNGKLKVRLYYGQENPGIVNENTDTCLLGENFNFDKFTKSFEEYLQNPFNENSDSYISNSWKSLSGTPQIGSSVANPINSTTSDIYNSKLFSEISHSEAIFQRINFQKGKKYLVRYNYRVDSKFNSIYDGKTAANSLDVLNVVLSRNQLVSSGKLSYSSWQSPNSNNSQSIDTVNNITSTNWIIKEFAFEADSNYTDIIFFPSFTQNGKYIVINIDNIVIQEFDINVNNSLTVCNGANVNLGNSGLNCPQFALRYNWSPGNLLNDSTVANPIFNPDSVGNYQFNLTVSFGTSPLSIFKNVNVNVGGFDMDLIAEHLYMLPNDTISILARINGIANTSQYNYYWNVGATDSIIKITEPDTFFVSVTSPSGCIVSKSINILPSPLNSFNSPSSLNLCEASSFDAEGQIYGLSNLAGGYDYEIIIGNKIWECNPVPIPPCAPITTSCSSSPNFQISNISLKINGIRPLFTVLNINNEYKITFNCSSAVCATNIANFDLEYDLKLDCNLLSNPLISLLSESYITIKSPPVGATSTTFSNLIPINFGYFSSIYGPNPIDIDANNGQLVDQKFIYENTGTAAIEIDFNFIDNLNCNGTIPYIVKDPTSGNWKYGVSNSSTTPPSSWSVYSTNNTANVNVGHFLWIMNSVQFDKCIDECLNSSNPTPNVIFEWKCKASPCSTYCRSQTTQVNYIREASSVKIQDASPISFPYTTDLSCFDNNLITTNTWKFEIVNPSTSKTTYPDLYVNLNSNALISLTEILKSGVQFEHFRGSNLIPISTTPTYNTPLPPLAQTSYCSSTNDLIYQAIYTIKDFQPGDVVKVQIIANRCCSSNDALFNANKVINHWSVSVSMMDICLQPVNPVANTISQVPSGTLSNFRLTGNASDPVTDLNLFAQSDPSNISQITCPPGIPPQFSGTVITYKTNINYLVGDEFDLDILGVNGGNILGGILKVEINLNPGLFIDVPILPNEVCFKKSSTILNSFYACSPIQYRRPGGPPAQCPGVNTYIFYFNLSNLSLSDPNDIINFFVGSYFQFPLFACCYSPNSKYELKFSISPNAICSSYGTPLPSPIPPQILPSLELDCSDCCWLPLSKVEEIINIQCPGCITPGIEINSYEFKRNTFGFLDSDNNGAADVPTFPLTESNLPAGISFNRDASMHNDEIVDHLTATFNDGDISNGGYKYLDCLLPSNPQLKLNYLQFLNKIPNSNDAEMDLQVKSFVFEVRDPSNALLYTFDCQDPSTFYERVSTNNEYLFTIPANIFSDPTPIVTPNSIVPQIPSGSTFEFLPLQTYDLKVTYKVNGGVFCDDGAKMGGLINCEMFLSTIGLSLAGALINGDAPSVNCSTIAADGNLDLYKFICTKGSTRHDFYPINNKNVVEINASNSPVKENGCENSMIVSTKSVIGRKTTDAYYDCFPNEYRASPVIPSKLDFKTPFGYKTRTYLNSDGNWVSAINIFNRTRYYASNGLSPFFASSPSGYEIVTTSCSPVSSRCSINVSNYYDYNASYTFKLDLLNSAVAFIPFLDPPALSTPLQLSDNESNISFEIPLEICNCNLPPAYSNVEDECISTITNVDLCSTFYNNILLPSCIPPAPPVPSYLPVCNNSGIGNFVVIPPHPNLSFSFLPKPTPAYSNTVSWDVKGYNAQNTIGEYSSASYVYLRIPTYDLNFTNWTLTDKANSSITKTLGIYDEYFYIVNDPSVDFYTNTSILPPNIITYIEATAGGGQFLDATLTATFSQCPSNNPYTMPILYGWNCDKFPNDIIPNITNACKVNSDRVLELSLKKTEIVALNVAQPTTYTMCDPIKIFPTFKSLEDGFALPTSITFDLSSYPTIDPSSVSISVYSSSCPTCSITYLYTGSNTFLISQNDANALFPNSDPNVEGYMQEQDEIYFAITYRSTCGYQGNVPDVIFNYKDYCGADRYINFPFPNVLIRIGANCSDCLGITKSCPVPDVNDPYQTITASPISNVQYNFEVCNYTGSTVYVNFNDVFNDFNLIQFDLDPNTPPAVTLNANGGGSYTIGNLGTNECINLFAIGNFTNTTSGTINNTATVQIIDPPLSKNIFLSDCSVFVERSCIDARTVVLSGPTITFDNLKVACGCSSNIISNQSFFINGVLDLGINTVEFVDCNFFMAPGSQIIAPRERLTLNRTKITACTRMWKGLVILDYSNSYKLKFFMTDSEIKDAEIGINILGYSPLIQIQNSSIVDCIVGLNFPEKSPSNQWNEFDAGSFITKSNFGMFSSSLVLPYLGQTGYLSKPKCGMEIWSLKYFALGSSGLGNPNVFKNCTSGIILYNSQRFNVNDNIFLNINDESADDYVNSSYPSIDGSAISSIKDWSYYEAVLNVNPRIANYMMENCDRGIFTYNSDASINDVKMNNVRDGIFCTKSSISNTVNIKNCTINASSCGIDWFDNNSALSMTAYNNTINMNSIGGNAFGAGIRINELSPPANAKNVQLNRITLFSHGNGIDLRAVDNVNVLSNVITQNINSSGVMPPCTGINVTASKNSNLTCNIVSANPLYTNTRGAFLSQSSDSRIECNTTTNNAIGFDLDVNCTNTILYTNTMNNNGFGIQCISGVNMGVQSNRGNVWNGFSGRTGAFFVSPNPGELGNNRFEVNSSSTPTGTPLWPLLDGSNIGWFVPNPDPTPTCNNPSCTNTFASNNDISTIDRLVALDSITYSNFTSESKYQSNQLLFNKLSQDSSLLLTEDTVITNFYTENQNTDVDYLAQAIKFQTKNTLMDSLKLDSLLLINEKISLLTDSLLILDSLFIQDSLQNYSTARQTLLDSMQVIETQRKLILEAQNAIVESALIASEMPLLNITGSELPLVNNKVVANSYAKYYRLGKSSIENDSLTLAEIAQQCPRQGGKAVYIARNFMRLFKVQMEYNDELACSLNGGARVNGIKSSTASITPKFTLIPNPATNIVALKNINSSLVKEIFITDAVGRVLQNHRIETSFNEKQFDVSNLNGGTYFFKIRLDDDATENLKLLIVK